LPADFTRIFSNPPTVQCLGSIPLFAYAIVDKSGFTFNDSFTSSIYASSATTITFQITRVNSNNSGWGNNYNVRWFAFN
jgi:hypothetical protein